MLASLLYPYDSDAGKLIEGWLTELDKQKCLRRYIVDGHSYIEICKWNEHQKIDHRSKSKYPPFDESSLIFSNPREDSGEDQGPRTKDQGVVAKEDSRLPDWIPIEAWDGWMEVRRKLKKNGKTIPWTDRCSKIALGKLERWHQEGYDLTVILDAATIGNWQGLYLPKDDHGQEIKPIRKYRRGDPNNPADWAAAIIPDSELFQ